MKLPLLHHIKNLFTARSVAEEQKRKKFDPRTRIGNEKMSDKEKMDKGFNGSTYSINGRDVDF